MQGCLKATFTFTMPEGRELRDYQTELASYGIKGMNYVACAPTGTGKTLIASIVVANHLTSNPNGKVLFLVNKVPLAEQQCHEVKKYIPNLQAQFITGDSGTQISLYQLFHENNMVVCTNGMFLNELKMAMLSSSERLSLSNVTLLIIDECHNTKKNSPYAMIMEEYIKIKMKGDAKEPLPQVMGLTASPGAGENPQGKVDKTLEHLLNLCALLDAQGGIQVVREHKVELVHYSNQPDFDLLKTSQRSSPDPFLNLLLDTMKLLEQWIQKNAGVSCSHDRQNQGYESWVVSQRQLSEQRDGPIERDIRSALHYLLCYCNALKMYRELNQYHAMTVLKEKVTLKDKPKVTHNEQWFQQIFHDFINKADQILCPVENPMLMRLTLLLINQFHSLPTTRGIVFVTTKDTAQRMCCWLQETPQLKGVIKPAVVTGQSKEEVGGMTLAKQRNTIEQFRNGQINLLVSTTVLEEGFDVPACNLVVRYNHVTNEIARVQAHGRARAEDSRCYAIMEVDSPKVLQEQLNKEKDDLTIVALEYLPEDIRLAEEIKSRQQKLLVERAQQQQLQRDLKTECDHVQLVCKRCDSLICLLGDVRVVAETHHVVINKDIYDRCDLKGPTTLATKREFEIGQKVHCKACGEEWGVMIKWPHRGMHYPAIKCKYVLFLKPNGAKEAYKQWKGIPFIVKKI